VCLLDGVKVSIVLPGVDDEILDLANSLKVNIDAVADPNLRGNWNSYKIFESDANLLESITPTGVIIAIDSPKIKKKLDLLYNTTLIDLIGGDIHRTSRHKAGLILQTGAKVSTNCIIGRCVKINTNATVMHDAIIGDYVTIAPRAVILGRVKIGAGTFIGANATLLPDIEIGANVIVGAGAVVTRNVSSGKTVKGVPAK
jgi:sugar O-acyltransferase (sialic acid O-acetyltransferase NeuD family)